MLKKSLMMYRNNPNPQFLSCLLAGLILLGMVIFPSVLWADAEGQNLRSSTLRQYDFLIARINNGEPFDPPAQTVVSKIVREPRNTFCLPELVPSKKENLKMVADQALCCGRPIGGKRPD